MSNAVSPRARAANKVGLAAPVAETVIGASNFKMGGQGYVARSISTDAGEGKTGQCRVAEENFMPPSQAESLEGERRGT